MNSNFNQEPQPQFSQEELVANAREAYGIPDRPMMQGEGGKWFTTDFDGTHIEVEEWNKKTAALSPNTRKSIN